MLLRATFPVVSGLPNTAPAQGNCQLPQKRPPGSTFTREALEAKFTAWCGEASLLGKKRQPSRPANKPYWEGPAGAWPIGQFQPAQRPDIAVMAKMPIFALGEHCQDFPSFECYCPGRSRLQECGRYAWCNPGLSSTFAFSFNLGTRPTVGEVRVRVFPQCQALQQ